MEEEKENNKEIAKKIAKNAIIVIAMIIYFFLMYICCKKMDTKVVLKTTKIASLIILAISIVIIEFAYHKENEKIALTGMEVLALAFYTLTIKHITSRINMKIDIYILVSTIVFAVYYVFKSMIIYTSEKRKFVKSLSDIHEIVSNTPIKKEAKKRRNIENS